MKSKGKLLIAILCLVLCVSMILSLFACTKDDPKLTKIEVSGPSEVVVGEFDYNAYTVKLIFDDGSTKDIKLDSNLLSASDRNLLNTPGEHTVTVKYNDVTCTFTVTIKGEGEPQDKVIKSISINGPSEVTIGEINYSDFSLVITYDDDSTATIELREEFIPEEDRAKLNTIGSHSISIIYNGVTTTFNITIKEKEFEGVTFEDATYTYDGTAKSIEVKGLPDGATVTYNVNNSYTDAGVYPIEATINKEGYKTLVLNATLTINKATCDMSGVKFENQTVTYNGEVQRLEISGTLPQGVTVTYENNENINVGTYEIIAKFTGDSNNYEPIADITATLTITDGEFEGVTFEDATYTYDGTEKSIEVKGLPDGATVTYNVNNSYIDAGVYPIEATINKEGYKTLVLNATLTINKATYDMSEVKFENKTVTYNGEVQRLEISGTLPQGVTVTYENNENINAGSYEIVAKFKGDSNNYEPIADTTATFTINKATYDMSGVKFEDKTVIYNGEVERLEISGILPQGVTVSYENNDNIDVGTYEVVAKFTGDSNNYETIADMTATLTINKATYDMSEVKFEDKTVIYNGEVQRLEISGALPQGVTVSYENNDNINVGTYAVVAKFTGDSNNYETVADMLATLTIEEAVETEGLIFEKINNDTEYSVVGYEGSESDIVILGMHDGLPVTSIGDLAFDGRTGLTSVTIVNGVTSIGDYAFYNCTGLTSVTIGNGVTSIGDLAFYGCTGLTSIKIQDSVTSIGSSAFAGCSGLIIYCEVSSKPDGWNNSWNGTNSLVVWDCNNNEMADDGYIYAIIDGIKYGLKDGEAYVSRYTQSVSGHVVIKDKVSYKGNEYTVTSIGYGAFDGCTGLTSITIPFVGEKADGTGATHFGYIFGASSYSDNSSYIPESLREVIITGGTSIESYAFRDCSGLTSVTIGNGVTSIGNDAFAYCTGLKSITVAEGNIKYHSQNNCIIETTSKTLILGCQTSIIPDDGSVTSIGYGVFRGCTGLKSITIPDSVTSIGSNAFEDCSGLTSITIPDSVTSVGERTFYNCTELTNVTIGNGVTSIGNDAFLGCTGLTSITIPDSVTNIGERAFYNCSGLTSVTIGNGVTSIGYGAFRGCTGLKSITIPDSVTSIGSNAFADCSELTSIAIPNSVTSIGQYAFYNCSELTSITIPFVGEKADETVKTHFGYIFGASSYSDNSSYVPKSLREVIITGSTSIGYYAFLDCTGLTSITIPDSVIIIQSGAFAGCSRLTSITIPDSVKSIGSYAFDGCTGLTSITIPDSVKSIGYGAFRGCTGLESITVGEGNIKYHSQNNCIIETTSKTLILGCQTSIIPADGSVIRIEECAFWGSGVTSVTIPKSITSIGYGAFRGCTGLKSITIPDSVTSIGNYAFEGCAGLTSITIPDSVTSVGERTFYNCTELTNVTIGNGVTSIGYGAFEGCTGLTSVTIGNGVTSIGNYAFESCTGLKNITIPDSVMSIGSGAFEGCTGLTSVTIGNGVISIGIYAFEGCAGLKSITIPDSVTSIGSGAFYQCTGLTSVTIGNGVTSIGGRAFNGCTGLTSVTIGNGVTSIGDLAFEDCAGLTSITIPDSVTSIGSYAFYNCSGLTSITIGNSVTSIGEGAFRGCTGSKSITIPDSVTSIGSSAFYNCGGYNEVYYKGTSDDWNSIEIGSFNECLTNATRYYYIENEADVPTDDGNYWHYGEDGVTPVIWPKKSV